MPTVGAKLRAVVERVVRDRLPAFVPVTPTYIQVELANRCNLRCVMCPIDELTQARAAKYLNVNEFEKVASQFPALRRVDLQGIGEPLVNPHLEGIVGWCHSRGIEVGFVTNGMLMTRDRAERLLRAGVTHMVFSMDSADPQTLAAIRRGADLERLKAGIRAAVEARRAIAGNRTFLGIMAIAMQQSLAGLPDLVPVAAQLGVDALVVKSLNPMTDGASPAENVDEVVARLRAAAARFPSLGVDIAFTNDRSKLRCRWPWTAAYVTAEGAVTPCCNCPDSRVLSFGNLFETPLASIWNGREYKAFRRELKSGMPAICRECPDY